MLRQHSFSFFGQCRGRPRPECRRSLKLKTWLTIRWPCRRDDGIFTHLFLYIFNFDLLVVPIFINALEYEKDRDFKINIWEILQQLLQQFNAVSFKTWNSNQECFALAIILWKQHRLQCYMKCIILWTIPSPFHAWNSLLAYKYTYKCD